MELIAIEPEAGKLIESMRDIGYSLETAIADIFDNSIAAGAKHISLLTNTNAPNYAVGILDDGRGMNREQLLEAMRPGSRSPKEVREGRDLGRFGLGLKTASFSQCRALTVITKKDSETSSATWDLDHVAKSNRWEVIFTEDVSGFPWSDRLGDHGTLVLWQKPDRITVDLPEADAQRHMTTRISDTMEHLELVFHRYLGRECNEAPVRMDVNGNMLRPFDPFFSSHEATQVQPEEKLPVAGAVVTVQAYTLPHHKKVTEQEWNCYAGRAGYIKNQGFYVYREKRLIIHGSWLGLARQQELTKLARVRIDTPRELDALWKIDVKKASAQPPAQIRDRLRQLIERIGATSKRVYQHRGRVLTDDNRLPVWNRTQKEGQIKYRVNLEHPLFRELKDGLSARSARNLDTALRLIAASLPIDALLVDLKGGSENVSGEAMLSADMTDAAINMYLILNEGAQFRNEAILAMIASVQPFLSAWDQVEAALAVKFGWEK